MDDSITKTFYLNVKILKYLRDNFNSFNLTPYDNPWTDKYISPPEAILKHIYKKLDLNTGAYTETYTRKRPIGRVFSGSNGLQFLRRELRNALVSTTHIDVDMVNSAPTILTQYCKFKNIPCDTLLEYVNDRSKIIEDISNTLKIQSEDAKYVVIKIIYGGFATVAERKSKWLIKLSDELVTILDKVISIESNEVAYQKTRTDKKTNLSGRVLSNVITNIENNILQSIDLFLKEKLNTQFDVLIFDGGLIEIKHKQLIIDNLQNISDYAFEKTGYRIQLIIKDMKEYIKINMNDVKDGINHEYEEAKQEFEKTVCKILYPTTKFIIVNPNEDTFYEKTEADLRAHFRNHPFHGCVHTKTQASFIDNWLCDPKLKTYDKVDLILSPDECPSSIYNVWKGFAVEQAVAKLKKPIKEEAKYVNAVQTHLKYLCNNDKVCFEYLENWLAQIIQFPGKLIGIAVVIKSLEGVGKNILHDFMTKIIGMSYSISVSNPEDTLFSKFNDVRENKILVNIDEVRFSDTEKFNDKIKAETTNQTTFVESKNQKRKLIRNFVRFLMFTNNLLCIRVSPTQRRFFMIECLQAKKSSEYYKLLAGIFDTIECQYSYFMHLKNKDISNFDFKAIPMTPLLQQSIRHCKNTIYQFLQELTYENLSEYKSLDTDINEYRTYIKPDTLYKQYTNFILHNKFDDKLSRNAFDQIIVNCNNIFLKKQKISNEKDKYYVFDQTELKNYMQRNLFWEYSSNESASTETSNSNKICDYLHLLYDTETKKFNGKSRTVIVIPEDDEDSSEDAI